jgi:GAF domain-containing protein
MRLRDNVIGSLNLFGAGPSPLPQADILVAQGLADVATVSLLQERAAREARVLSDQLTAALDSRVVVEQAKGVLAEQANLGMEEAFEWLRRYAREHDMRLSVVAGDLVGRNLAARELDPTLRSAGDD